jgi:adenosylhomocysteinase
VTKSKFDNIYGCRESLVDGIKRAMDVMIAGKMAFVCGYGDVGKGCAEAMRRIMPKYGFRGGSDLRTPGLYGRVQSHDDEDALPYANIYVTTTGNCDIITPEHMSAMRDQSIVCNIGHFDNEIQVARLKAWPGIMRQYQAPSRQVYLSHGHCIYLLAEGRLVNLGCATGHPSS